MLAQQLSSDLAKPALDEVASNRVAHGLAGDETHACDMLRISAQQMHDQMSGVRTATTSAHLGKVAACPQAVSPIEHVLRSEFGTALATTGVQDRTAGAGGHAGTEAVLLGTTTVVGLESALAHEYLRKFVCDSASESGN